MENNQTPPEETKQITSEEVNDTPSTELEAAVFKFLNEKDTDRKQAKDINAAREQQQRARFNNDRRRF